MDPGVAAAVDSFLEKLDACVAAEQDFHIVLNDPAGCSWFQKKEHPEQVFLVESRDCDLRPWEQCARYIQQTR